MGNEKTYWVQIGESLNDIVDNGLALSFDDVSEKDMWKLIRLALTYGKSFTVESIQ